MRSSSRLPAVCGVLAMGLAGAAQAADVPHSPFLAVVYKYVDTLLEKGRDTYGPQQTPLLVSALDREAMTLLTTRPAPPWGIRRGDRDGLPWEALIGANLQHDQNFLRLLYLMSQLANHPRYAEAADGQLKWFLENAASEETGLLPWGEHMSWNVATDQPMASGERVHEFSRPWLLWDRCFAVAPEQSKRFALGLWEHQIADHETGGFDRHATYDKHGPKDGSDFPRHAGFYIRTWGDAYAHTQDEVFLRAIDVLLARYEKKRDPVSGLILELSGRTTSALLSTLSLAIDCDAAARHVPEELGTRLRAFAAREDAIFCAVPHDLEGRMGFATVLDYATGKPVGGCTKVWEAQYGGSTTASVGLMCLSRHTNVGGDAYRNLIVKAADVYLRTLPGEDVDAWPLTFGHAIALELGAWRLTAREAYLKRAEQLGRIAVERFFEGQALPRASFSTGHYESITGADTLALALTDLHLTILHITAVDVPSNSIDR